MLHVAIGSAETRWGGARSGEGVGDVRACGLDSGRRGRTCMSGDSPLRGSYTFLCEDSTGLCGLCYRYNGARGCDVRDVKRKSVRKSLRLEKASEKARAARNTHRTTRQTYLLWGGPAQLGRRETPTTTRGDETNEIREISPRYGEISPDFPQISPDFPRLQKRKQSSSISPLFHSHHVHALHFRPAHHPLEAESASECEGERAYERVSERTSE